MSKMEKNRKKIFFMDKGFCDEGLLTVYGNTPAYPMGKK
jgi:hypothetical protein